VVFQATNHQMYSCLIRMDRKLQIVIASWPDQSINHSNGVSSLATELVSHYQFHPKRLLLIEHNLNGKQSSISGPIYFLVTFHWNQFQAEKPIRHPLSLAEFTQIVLILSSHS